MLNLYASTQPFTVNEDGKKRYTHKHWGTLDEDLRSHPGTAYFYASIEERQKLIFPKEWDLSEIESLSGNKRRGRIGDAGACWDSMRAGNLTAKDDFEARKAPLIINKI